MEPLALYLVEYDDPDNDAGSWACVVRAHSLEEAFAIWRYDMIAEEHIEPLASDNLDRYENLSASVCEIGEPLTDGCEIMPLRHFTYFAIAHTSLVTLAVDAHLNLNVTTVGSNANG